MEKVDIVVIKKPVSVDFDCPKCKELNSIEYRDFCADVGEPCDWKWSKIECYNCNQNLEINYVDWD